MNTLETNKLIAEFMGARPIVFNDGTHGHTFWNEEGRSESFPDGFTNYFDYSKGYNTSWDWLMLCVEKIEKITNNFGKLPDLHGFYFDGELFVSTDIEKTYNTVIKFIQWYNEQNK